MGVFVRFVFYHKENGENKVLTVTCGWQNNIHGLLANFCCDIYLLKPKGKWRKQSIGGDVGQ